MLNTKDIAYRTFVNKKLVLNEAKGILEEKQAKT